MNRSSNASTTSSNAGPLRRNQACHQCRARKLKCDAGRPCSTCKRSHAKAIASLTSSGQTVLADPCCTYDYGPGEDPWTATLRNGLALSHPKTRSKSGSVSPGNSPSDVQVSKPKTSTSAPLPSSAPSAGPVRTRPVPNSRKRSPPYASPGRTSPLTHDSAYDASPRSLGALRGTGAHDGFLSPPPSIDVRGVPALAEPSGLPTMPPYVSAHSMDNLRQDFEYDEMVEMLYNPMGPFFDSPTLFSSSPSYVNTLSSGEYPGSEAPLYAHDSLDSVLLDPRSLMPLNLPSGPSASEVRGVGSAPPLNLLSPHRGPTR